MGLKSHLVSKTNIKSDANLFHELFTNKPHHISNICPDMVQSVDLHSGRWGAVGSVVVWTFVLDGKKAVSKEIVEAIDEKKKSVTYKAIEGDLANVYTTFKFIIDVEKKGNDNIVTWTLEYEKKNEDVPDPCGVMDVCVNITKEIERHCLLVPN